MLAVFASLNLAPLPAAAQGAFAQVPAEYRGDWVAAAAACTAPVRVRVEPTRITLVNGTDTESLGGLEMAGPGFFPPDYKGIQAVAITEFSGDQPLSATLQPRREEGCGDRGDGHAGPGQARRRGRERDERALPEAEPGEAVSPAPGASEEVPGGALASVTSFLGVIGGKADG